jgi:DNA-binding NarL/FixJ family response regulator
MLRIVLATARPKALRTFAEALSSDPEVELTPVASGAEALEAVQASTPHLVIIDSGLPDVAPLELVQRMLMLNAMVNTAVISPLSDAEFHGASEGLGVLGQLPDEPGGSEATEVMRKLRTVLGRG